MKKEEIPTLKGMTAGRTDSVGQTRKVKIKNRDKSES